MLGEAKQVDYNKISRVSVSDNFCCCFLQKRMLFFKTCYKKKQEVKNSQKWIISYCLYKALVWRCKQ